MTNYPHKAHHKLGSNGVTQNELIRHSTEVLEASRTPLSTKQIADQIQQRIGVEVNLQILGSVLNNEIPMIQRDRQRIKNGAISLYSLPQLIGGNEA